MSPRQPMTAALAASEAAARAAGEQPSVGCGARSAEEDLLVEEVSTDGVCDVC